MKKENKAETKTRKVIDFLKKHKKAFLVVFFLLIALRLWLFLTMNWYVNMDTYYDSRLEVNSSIDVATLQWGGAYSKVTLCKGLAFPMFLAVLFLFRIPYSVGLFLLIVLAAFAFSRSLKPLIKSSALRKIIFLFILYNPVGLGGEMSYPYRNAVLPWAVLIVVACIIAIYLRRKAKCKKLLPWAFTGLFFAGFFWNLREDSIWFLPFMLVGAIAMVVHYLIDIKKNKEKIKWKQKLCFALIAICPLIGVWVWNTGISLVNKVVYGVYTTEDRTHTYSAKVLGALIRIDDGADLENDYWVSGGALELAKEASPTFASLDLTSFDNWSKVGDFSIWALRDSVEASGYYKDAVTTNELYKKIYDELEEGFKNGTLKRKNGIQLSDTSGLYSMNEVMKPFSMIFKSLINHITYDEYEVKLEEVKNVKNEGDIILYEKGLGIDLLRSDEEMAKMGADGSAKQVNIAQRILLKANKVISNVIIKIYNVMSWILFVAAVAGFIVKMVVIFKNKDYKNYNIEIIILMTGVMMTILFYSYMVGLWGLGYDLTPDSSLFKSYTTPQTILVSVFEVLGMIALVTSLTKIKHGRRKKK